MLFIDLIAAFFHKIVYFTFSAGWSFEKTMMKAET
jgi:hypothetical protein